MAAKTPPISGNPRIGPEDNNVVLKFGGGLHTRASPDEIDGREAADGFNFLIDIQNRNLRSRPPFDLIGTVPNGLPIQGGACLLKADGTVSTLFQAAGVVYQWDGVTTFTPVGSINPGSRMRGHWDNAVWNLTDVVLITDLALADTVKQWDGTTFSSPVFTDEKGRPFGSFKAKYIQVSDERAIFGNVVSGAATPHMMVGTQRSNYLQLTVVDTPSSALGESDPFFLLSPDLKPINGFINAFKVAMISSEHGQIYVLNGSSAKDFAFDNFYAGSSASGDESMDETGNDFMYGRPGRIESVKDTQNYGNSQSSDLTAIVADQITTFPGWTINFNSRTRKSYAFPIGGSEVWVLDEAIRDSGNLSPWMRWRTSHPMAFQPTFVMSMLDPADGLEYIFMGDSSGNVYRMEGTGANGDGGTHPIQVQFLSKLVSARLDSKAYDCEGYIKYQRDLSSPVNLTFQYQGESIFNKAISVVLPTVTQGSFYGDSAYYSGDFFYGTTSGKMARMKFDMPGYDNEFQVLVDVTGNNDFSINEIGIRFRATS